VVNKILQEFFCSTPKGSFSSMLFRFSRWLYRFQTYLRLNTKVVVNRTDFCTFVALPNVKGAVPLKTVLALTPPFGAASSAKVSLGFTF